VRIASEKRRLECEIDIVEACLLRIVAAIADDAGVVDAESNVSRKKAHEADGKGVVPDQAAVLSRVLEGQKWLHNFGRGDRWNFYLTAGTIVARELASARVSRQAAAPLEISLIARIWGQPEIA
jgi:hypothetical protein